MSSQAAQKGYLYPVGPGHSSIPFQISFSVDLSQIYRHVRRSDGSVVTSSVPNMANSGDLASDFDLSWLRCSSTPLPPQTVSKENVRVVDLFAGCGAMSLGFWEACRALNIGFGVVLAAELDVEKAVVYERNLRPGMLQTGPLESLIDGAVGTPPSEKERNLIRTLGKVDVLLGGPPCQGHSDLNNHTRRSDPRNDLVSRMTRFAELFLPSYVVVENVGGARHDHLRAFERARKRLTELGYAVEEIMISCANAGVPQTRRRFMMVASLSGALNLGARLAMSPTVNRTAGWAIEDLLNTPYADVFNSSANHSAENNRRINFLFEHNLFDLPNTERPPCHRDKAHSYNSVYGRMRWDAAAPTITTGFGSTGQGRFVHPLQPRTLTPHEAARLQTIPDFFEFGGAGRTQLQKMIGNSVPPLAMAKVALELLR